jgi:hypothetical protein
MKVVKRDPNVEMKLAYYDCMERLGLAAGSMRGMLTCLDKWVDEAKEKYLSLGGSIEEGQELHRISVEKSNGRGAGPKIVKGDFSAHPAGSTNEA